DRSKRNSSKRGPLFTALILPRVFKHFCPLACTTAKRCLASPATVVSKEWRRTLSYSRPRCRSTCWTSVRPSPAADAATRFAAAQQATSRHRGGDRTLPAAPARGPRQHVGLSPGIFDLTFCYAARREVRQRALPG